MSPVNFEQSFTRAMQIIKSLTEFGIHCYPQNCSIKCVACIDWMKEGYGHRHDIFSNKTQTHHMSTGMKPIITCDVWN